MKFKKPFRDTKAGKILLNPIVKSGLSLIPFGLGSVASNILDRNGSPVGMVDTKTMPIKVMKMVIYAVLIYLVLAGKIDFDQAEQAKSLLSQ